MRISKIRLCIPQRNQKANELATKVMTIAPVISILMVFIVAISPITKAHSKKVNTRAEITSTKILGKGKRGKKKAK